MADLLTLASGGTTGRWCRRVLLPKGVALASSCGIVAAQLALMTFEPSTPMPMAAPTPDIIVSLVSPDLVPPPPVLPEPTTEPVKAAKAETPSAQAPSAPKRAQTETVGPVAETATAVSPSEPLAPAPRLAASVPVAPAQAAPLPPSHDDTALRAYQEQVWRMIMARRPTAVRLRGGAMISFRVMGDGVPCDVGIVRTSGDPMLDRLALDTVRRAGPFPKPPSAIAGDTLFQIWFQFG